MDCFCDYDPADVYRASIVAHARTRHTCSECGRLITIGERYERVFGVWEGDANTFKTCSRCLDLRDFVASNVPCFCWAHGNIIEDAMETAEEYHEPGNGLLFGAYRRKVKILRNERHEGSQP